jgi:hypothetical protein
VRRYRHAPLTVLSTLLPSCARCVLLMQSLAELARAHNSAAQVWPLGNGVPVPASHGAAAAARGPYSAAGAAFSGVGFAVAAPVGAGAGAASASSAPSAAQGSDRELPRRDGTGGGAVSFPLNRSATASRPGAYRGGSGFGSIAEDVDVDPTMEQ